MPKSCSRSCRQPSTPIVNEERTEDEPVKPNLDSQTKVSQTKGVDGSHAASPRRLGRRVVLGRLQGCTAGA